jgi:asparagine synthase (glutamine-hydrolysing)
MNDDNVMIERDLPGLRPVFYTVYGGKLFHADTVDKLFTLSSITPALSLRGLAELFLLGPARLENSGVFEGVRALPPGYRLRMEDGNPVVERFTDFTKHPHGDDEEATAMRVRTLLMDAVSSRLIVGDGKAAFLSGGLDSSLITAIMAETYREHGKRLNTFSFDFAGGHFTANAYQPDRDRPWVDVMVNHCKTQHTHIECTAEELADLLCAAVDARGFPGMADVDASLLYFCMKTDCSTAFTGEGADEIFGGYPWFHRTLPERGLFPWSGSHTTRTALLKNDFINALHIDVPAGGDITYRTLKWFMPVLLERMRCMGAHAGVAMEAPFASQALMEYAFNIPWPIQAKDGVAKYILRKAARGWLPEAVIKRRKSPFPKTYDPSYARIVTERLMDTLNDPASPARAFIDRNKAEAYAKNVMNGEPWFGQLMAGPQMLAYILQIDYWMRKYGLTV